MMVILKLKLLKLREEIKMIGIMTGMTLLMIAVFSSIDYTVGVTEFGYIDEEKSELTSKLLEELNKEAGYAFISYTLEMGKEAVKAGEISGAFYIEKGFTKALESNQASINKLLTSETMDTMQMNNLIMSALNSARRNLEIANQLSQVVSEVKGIEKAEVKSYIYSIIQEHWESKVPIAVSVEEKKTPEDDSVKQSVIGFSLFFGMFTIIFTIADILTEKENHTWARLMISPLKKSSILTGNLLSTFTVGFIQVSLMFIVSKYLFKVAWQGNMFNLLIVIAAFVFCVTAFGLFMANFLKTMGQLSAVASILITGTAMLGGCFWPLEIVSSKIILALANITPQKWAVAAIKDIVVYGYGMEKALGGVLILLLMGGIYLGLGIMLANRRVA